LAKNKDSYAPPLGPDAELACPLPAVGLALLVELTSEAVVGGPADDALLVEGGDDAVRLLLDEGDAVAVVGEVYERPLELLAPVLLLKDIDTERSGVRPSTSINSISIQDERLGTAKGG